MKSKKLEIEIPEGKTAVWRNGILTLIDEPEKDVKERIKTFEDACREIGIDADRKSTRLNSSHRSQSRMPSSA